MSIMVRTATSVEMKKNKSIIRKMYSRKQFDENMLEVNWRAARKLSNLSYRFFPREDGVKGYRVRIGGTVSELSLPDNVKEGAVILYIHGGGFVSGSASASRSYASVLAKYTGYRVISAEYIKCTHKNGHIPFLKSHFSDTTFLRLSGDIPGKWTPYFYKNPVFRTQYFKFVSDDVKYNQVEVYTHD